jgi:hypothetical protein
MAIFTDFKLYWESWGGYPDRSFPFGNPSLFWLLASGTGAARCAVARDSSGPARDHWTARWEQVPWDLAEPLPALLRECGAFGEPAPIVTDAVDGDYRVVWDLTGVSNDEPFHLCVNYILPGERWTPLGIRLRDALGALQGWRQPEAGGGQPKRPVM